MKTMVEGELDDGGSTSFTLVFLLVMSDSRSRDSRRSRRNIFAAGYEFEGDRTAIS
jgi:hypothetical protein